MYFISSSSSKNKPICQAVEELAGFGISNIELSGNLVLHKGWQEGLVFLKNKYGLNFLIHNYFPPPAEGEFVLNIASANCLIKQKTFSLIEDAIKLMDKLAIPLYSIHNGFRTDESQKLDDLYYHRERFPLIKKETASKALYENIKVLAGIFLKAGHRVAVENTFPFDRQESCALITTPEEIRLFLDYIQKYNNLGFLLDLGHLNVTARIFGFDAASCARRLLSDYPDKIFELHLSGNDGTFDSHSINKIDCWQLDIIDEFPHLVSKIPVVFEWHRDKHTGDDIRKGLSMLSRRFSDRVNLATA